MITPSLADRLCDLHVRKIAWELDDDLFMLITDPAPTPVAVLL